MYKLIKKNLEYKLIDYVKTHSSDDINLINTNPLIMKALCKKDPKFIKYVRGPAISIELLDMVMNHEKFDISIIKEALSYYYGIGNHPEIMKKLCSMDGSYIRYCRGKGLTFEIFQLALNSQKKISELDIQQLLTYADFEGTALRDVEKFIEYDGRLLQKVDDKQISKSLMEQAFNHPDPLKRPDIRSVYIIRDSKKLMKYACEIDGLNFIYGYEESLTPEILKIALNHPDPDKRLSIDRIPKNFEMSFKYKDVKELVALDERWMKYVDSKSINEGDLIHIIKNTTTIPDSETIYHYRHNKNVLNIILEEARKGKYTEKQLIEMISFEKVNRRFINGEFFKEITKIICEKENIDYEFFKYFIQRAMSTNDEIFCTLNFDLLNSRFHKLYEENGYEKLFTLTVYPEIQSLIVEIGNPTKEDGTIDIELGNKRLELLFKLLKSSIISKNGEKIKDWPTYYNKIIKAFADDPDKFNYFVDHQNELNDNLIRTLTNHVLGTHSFEIKTIEDLKNYEQIRKKWIEENINSDDKDKVREAAFEKVFGISMQTIRELKPYSKGILASPNSFHPDMVEFFRVIDKILKEENIELLRKTVKAFERHERLNEKDIVHLRSMIKRQYVKEYNNTLFKIEGRKPDGLLRGVKLYKAAGKKGDQEFGLCIHALGAYFGSDGLNKIILNYQKDWNRPQISNHGICSSYIGNNNLGTAATNFAVLGFTDYEEGSLLLAGPEDIYSSNESFDTIGDEDGKSTYLMPREMLDYTRHTHNEIVFERKVGFAKRQPAYAVLICDNYQRALWQYRFFEKLGRYTILGKLALENHRDADNVFHAIKAAKEFGIPIVVVEREKIAKNEHKKIMDRLEEFKNDEEITQEEAKEYFHDIITTFASNYAGCRNYHLNIVTEYFNGEEVQNIVGQIKEKINECSKTNPKMALMLLDELSAVMRLEEEITPHYTHTIFSTKTIISYCDNQKKKIILDMNKDTSISCVFNGTIKDNAYLMEYNSCYISKYDDDPYEMSDINYILSSKMHDKIFITINEIDKEGLYIGREESAHSRNHVENVILFASIIGNLELEEKDIDLLLAAALYHDAGRTDDKNTPHSKTSSDLALERLKGKYSEEDLQIIRAAIEYHEVVEIKKEDGSIDFTNLDVICKNLGMDTNDTSLMEKTRKIATCLKDADALDRTRFLANSREFINPDLLHYESSKKLIKVGMQINEYHASEAITRVCDNNPDISSAIIQHLEQHKNPKYTIRSYRHGELKVDQSEEVINHGKK